jgi:hypothetical protein
VNPTLHTRKTYIFNTIVFDLDAINVYFHVTSGRNGHACVVPALVLKCHIDITSHLTSFTESQRDGQLRLHCELHFHDGVTASNH